MQCCASVEELAINNVSELIHINDLQELSSLQDYGLEIVVSSPVLFGMVYEKCVLLFIDKKKCLCFKNIVKKPSHLKF
jgi:hypothetical protein